MAQQGLKLKKLCASEADLPGGTHDGFAADAMEDVNVFRYFLEKSAVIPFYFVLQ